jgi:hypothetical protein
MPLKTAKNIEEAITEFTNLIIRELGAQHQTTNIKLNIPNAHGKSRNKLRKNENQKYMAYESAPRR